MSVHGGDEPRDDDVTDDVPGGPADAALLAPCWPMWGLLDDPCPACGAPAGIGCDPDSRLCWGGELP